MNSIEKNEDNNWFIAILFERSLKFKNINNILA